MERFSAYSGVAGAKINLLLDVVGKRQDGYHLIDGVMQTLRFGDRLTVEAEPGGSGLYLRLSNGDGVPDDGTNLVYRAADRFLTRCDLNTCLTLTLDKRIPVAAGLAGGSTDAACTLRLLNRMAGERALPDDALLEIARSLGADVPFCLLCQDGAMRTAGTGDLLTPVPGLPRGCTVVVAKSGEGVSTPWGYGRLDELYSDFAGRQETVAARVGAMRAALESGELDRIAAACCNIFEEAVIPVRPAVGMLKEQMLKGGAKAAMMSGSGPAVFGLFDCPDAAQDVAQRLAAAGAQAFVSEVP